MQGPLLHSDFCCAEHSVHQVSVYSHLMGHSKEPGIAWRYFFSSLSKKKIIQLIWNMEWKWFFSLLLMLLCQLPHCRDSTEKQHWDVVFYTAQQGALCFPCQIHPAADKSFKGYTHEGLWNECSWRAKSSKQPYAEDAG